LRALHYRDHTPAFLNLEFHDKFAAQPAAAHTPDARATFALCKQDAVAGPNVVNPALMTCACLRNRKVARLAVRAPSP
jgi:hypothetical protein